MSSADLAVQAVDTGGTLSARFTAVLLLVPGPTPDDALGGVVADRPGGVPRLRQRLVRVLDLPVLTAALQARSAPSPARRGRPGPGP